ncbi:ethanolamine ammonia-lyase light chain EutC, partial [Klebsiella pneumoniae]|uniref:ethanolamine ammonia-lyase light chain EutC n=1 Tax=Klebsiella pneumoniae TaxID=573 RepID=UPI000E3A8F64
PATALLSGLVGSERCRRDSPGLGQSESLSCYAVYSPRVATTVEADRTCISNIHQGGTPPVEAAAVIVDLAKRMLEQKASGINMSPVSYTHLKMPT